MAKIGIRPGRADDLPALTELYNHYVRETAITFDVVPWRVDQRRAWLARFSEDGPHRLLVAHEDGAPVGYASSLPFRDKAAYATSVETTIYLAHARVGRGLGPRLYTELFETLRGQDLHRAYAGITLPNPASRALHLRVGFAPVGIYREVGRKFGRYWDVEWFERALNAAAG